MKLLRKVVLVGILLALLNQIPNFFLSEYYGNKIYSAKFQRLDSDPDRYNSVVMGSMKHYRHLNPQIFDKSLSEYGYSTFNLAAPTTDHPESLYLYEKLLQQNDHFGIKLAVIELEPMNAIRANNITSPRNYYWHNFDDFIYAIRYAVNGDDPVLDRLDHALKYSASYASKLVNIFGFKALNLKDKPLSLGRNQNGYYALDQEMVDIGGENFFINRLAQFHAEGHDRLKARHRDQVQASMSSSKASFTNPVFLERLRKLIETSSKNDVHVVFVISPRSENYAELLALKAKLPRGHLIDMADPKKYQTLYSIENSFDVNHLNERGGTLFTELLAEAFKETLMREPVD